ncbi:MAG: VacJ family lipoprotein [Nevskiaceae bacterium]|nr:MAG: VacJ family lipoprotein [Nevskiaceae bacterium]
MPKLSKRLALVLSCLALGACAHSPVSDPSDPLEPVNRVMFSFNEKLDHYVAKPAAQGYNAALPEEFRTGLHNFFTNLTYPTVIVNDALQGKLKQSGLDTTRFLMNTVIGLGGFLDPATMVGLERNDEDFGQTLGVWGVGQGWYLMLPLLGPSTNRDLVGRVGSAVTNPLTYTTSEISIPTEGVSIVDTRAQLLGSEGILDQQLDRYIFVRSAYLQHRQSLVYDGNPPREKLDFGDDDDTAPTPPSK